MLAYPTVLSVSCKSLSLTLYRYDYADQTDHYNEYDTSNNCKLACTRVLHRFTVRGI